MACGIENFCPGTHCIELLVLAKTSPLLIGRACFGVLCRHVTLHAILYLQSKRKGNNTTSRCTEHAICKSFLRLHKEPQLFHPLRTENYRIGAPLCTGWSIASFRNRSINYPDEIILVYEPKICVLKINKSLHKISTSKPTP
jgi:hypothetical protein